MPTSNETRVRVDDLLKISAHVCPARDNCSCRPRSFFMASEEARILPMSAGASFSNDSSCFMGRFLSLCARFGTRNPPPTPPRRGTFGGWTTVCSPPGRGRGWVGYPENGSQRLILKAQLAGRARRPHRALIRRAEDSPPY